MKYIKHYELVDYDKGLIYRFKERLGAGAIYSFDIFRFGNMDEGEPDIVPYEEYSEADFVINEVKRLSGSEDLLTALRFKKDTKEAIENNNVFNQGNYGVEYLEEGVWYRIYKVDNPNDTVALVSNLYNVVEYETKTPRFLLGSVKYDQNGDRYFIPEGETEPYYDLDYFVREDTEAPKIEIRKETIEVFTVPDSIKKLSQKEKLELIKQYFQNEYQGKSVTYEVLGEEIEATINAKTHNKFRSKGSLEKPQHYRARINIGANHEFMTLIANAEYDTSKPEHKTEQNSLHKATTDWHYFTKTIIYENQYHKVNIDVRENLNGEMFVYNVSLDDIDEEKIKIETSISTGKAESIAHLDTEIITENLSDVKDEQVADLPKPEKTGKAKEDAAEPDDPDKNNV